jgi:predicted phosphodiesterase
MSTLEIKPKFFLFSDTHGIDNLPASALPKYADAVLHCGDLVE